MKGVKEWIEFKKSEKFPDFLPKNPEESYKDEWQGATDWVGGKHPKYLTRDQLLSFEEAREYVRALKLKGMADWYVYCKSGKKPDNIPVAPFSSYKKEWIGFADWLGKKRVKSAKARSFEEAREFARALRLENRKEWDAYVRSDKCPFDIPRNPNSTYKGKFSGWDDWLNIQQKEKFLSYEEAKEYLKSKGIKTSTDFINFGKQGNRPNNIPSSPSGTYKTEWEGWGDFLGSGNKRKVNVTTWKSKFLPFDEARKFAKSLNFGSQREWMEWKKHEKPNNIPSMPNATYKDEWKGWPDFLGYEPTTGKAMSKIFLTYEEAREYVRALGLKGQKEWFAYAKSAKRPKNIPSMPYSAYKDKWVNLADWLGTTRTRSTKFLPYEEAREYVRTLNILNIETWLDYCGEGKIPQNIPNSPDSTYVKEWVNWYDWFGTDDSEWTVSNVKELLRELIKSKIIYQWDEAVLYSFLLRRGVLGTSGKHHEFFKNLIQASRDSEGMKTIEGYVKSNNTEPPDLSPFAGDTAETDEEIKDSENEGEALEENEGKDPLEKKYLESVHDILAHTEVLESISIDDEAMQFYVNYTLNQLWKRAFDNENETIRDVRNSDNSGNKYHDLVVKTFLEDYQKTIDLEMPKGYTFRDPVTNELISPFLMQKYVAYKIKSQPSFGNFSGTGAGKTLSAIIGSRVIDSKFTLIVCPNDVVKHWRDNILESFPNSKIISGKEVFDAKYDENVHQYLVLNYDKLNQQDSVNQILKLSKQKIDFVILDEIHFSKITSDRNISIRRENLEGLLSYARKINPEVKVLGLSATPVVNNINEGKSLLELMTGKVYDDLVTRPTISNAVALYEKLSIISIRQIPNYPKYNDERVDVDANKPDKEQIKYLNNNPLAIEQILTEARLPQIIKRINGQTIIYTEYVTKIIDKIAQAVDEAGYKFGFYVGGNDTGLEPFKRKEIQVLIASRPISTGVDGLQRICNNLIFNTLPWTNAQYIQLIGRIVRTGQDKEVSIHHVFAGIGGYLYDHLKMNRIKFKKTLADCAVDGVLPERNLVTPQRATKEAIAWLERLESGKVTSITRRELDV